MLSLEFLNGPLMKAAGALKKIPGAPDAAMTTGTTPQKPILNGMIGKPLQGLPALPEMNADAVSSVPIRPTMSDPLAGRLPATGPGLPEKAEDVPIPALPGRTGGPRPFDPQTKAEYEYVMSKVPRDEEGNERKLTFGERFKSSLLPALLGTVQGINSSPHNPISGAIGGAGAGFTGGMINPTSARQYEWAQMYKPELDQQEAHRGQEEESKRRADEALVNLEARRAGIDYTKAQTDAMKVNNRANAAYKDSQIRLNEARAQALVTGKPQIRDVVGDDGQIRTYQIFPDQSMVELGGSAKAAMNTENNATKRGIADSRNATQMTVADRNAAAAMNRMIYKNTGQAQPTGTTQAGQNQRAVGSVPGTVKSPAKPAGSGKTRTRSGFIADAVANGYSREEAAAFADRVGLK